MESDIHIHFVLLSFDTESMTVWVLVICYQTTDIIMHDARQKLRPKTLRFSVSFLVSLVFFQVNFPIQLMIFFIFVIQLNGHLMNYAKK